MNEDILSVVYLLLVLALVLPGFIYKNRNKKTLFNNLILWFIIIGVIIILFKFLIN